LPENVNKTIERRAFWSGTLTFGLVSVPVALFPGNRTVRPSLRMLAPDGTPLRRRYFCPKENRPLNNEEIIRGVEIEKGRFVVVTDEELESVEPKKSREIDLRRFVPRERIDPIYFDRAYFLVPTGDSSKAYRLLAETMEKMDRAGVATFVMRGKEYLVAILSEQGILRAETLRFATEIRDPQDIGLDLKAPAEQEVKAMRQAVREALIDHFDPTGFQDQAEEKKWDLIQKKLKAGQGIVHPSPDREGEDEERRAEVIDLMEVLKRKLAAKETPGPKKKKMSVPEKPGHTQAEDRGRPPSSKKKLSQK
jgi:DNA end-binding protein Ku